MRRLGLIESIVISDELRQRLLLSSVDIKVVSVEPLVERLPPERPFLVDDGEPVGVAIACLHYPHLSEGSLICIAQTEGSPSGGGVQ